MKPLQIPRIAADVHSDQPRVQFYIEGYASTRGEDIIYNLVLSAKRAETCETSDHRYGHPGKPNREHG